MEETRLEQQPEVPAQTELSPEGQTGLREEQTAAPVPFEALLRDNRSYQSAFDRKVEKALQTARANWEREQAAALEQQRAQTLEEARSTAQAEYRQRLAGLEAREAEHARRVRQVETADQLVQLGLPARFAPWLTGDTQEESRARVTAFDAAFRAAVSDTVTERMAGTPPTQPEPPQSFDRQRLRGMTSREINAHWAEIQDTLKG